MTTTTVTLEQIRNLTGIDSALMTDSVMQGNLDRTCDYVDPFFNIKTTPVKMIDFIEVVDEFSIDVNKNPLLSIKAIRQNNSNIDIQNLQFTSSGAIRLDFRRFYNNGSGRRNNMVFVEYLYGWMETKDEKEQTTTSLLLGTSVDITVLDSTSYTIGGWIRLKGFDGNQEVAKITALPSATSITVEQLVFNHGLGSLIEKLKTPDIIDQYILYETGLSCAINAIGGTYTFNTSYSIEGVTATKGVPYPHFDKVYGTMKTQRDILKTRINDSFIRVL
jgi:hypothetical protein